MARDLPCDIQVETFDALSGHAETGDWSLEMSPALPLPSLCDLVQPLGVLGYIMLLHDMLSIHLLLFQSVHICLRWWQAALTPLQHFDLCLRHLEYVLSQVLHPSHFCPFCLIL